MNDQDLFKTSLRTLLCGDIRAGHAGTTVRLGGWVHRSRDLGGLAFIDLRDRGGIVQVSLGPAWSSEEARAAAATVGLESVVLVEGEVVERPPEMRNPELGTGDIEVRARSFTVVAPAATPAIPVSYGRGERLAAEELRLRYRYLDLRRPELRDNLMLRHRIQQAARQFLSERGFLEIETPVLTRPTPEGARDFLVPSRVHRGEFFALPQSPQLYKQLLMVSGFDRYFQIARCFRDEDLRADRQPEFSQIDIEASFVTPEDVFAVGEGLLSSLWAVAGVQVETPFPRLPYADAMARFGTDKPDLRYALEIEDATDVFRGTDFGIARRAIDEGGRIRGIRIAGGASLSRKQVDEIETTARAGGAAGLLRLTRTADGLEGPAAKFLPEGAADRLSLREGDRMLLVAGSNRITSASLDRVRQDVAARLSLIPANEHRFAWVESFPLFARDPQSGALMAEHHPFTAPHPDDEERLESNPDTIRSLAYDCVYNGVELASGSIRIHSPALQERVFALLGIDAETAEARFGFLLEGLRSGAPPHGGIAYGVDRIAMLLAGATSLRDVIAFPKTTASRALFENAPTPVGDDELAALHVRRVDDGQ